MTAENTSNQEGGADTGADQSTAPSALAVLDKATQGLVQSLKSMVQPVDGEDDTRSITFNNEIDRVIGNILTDVQAAANAYVALANPQAQAA